MSDPEELYAKLASGDAGRVLATLEPLSAARTALESVELPAVSSWAGDAAVEFARRVTVSRTALSTATGRLTDAMSVVEAVASAYRTMRGAADQAIRAYRSGAPTAEVTEVLTGLRSSYEDVLRSYATVLRGFEPVFTTVAGRPGTMPAGVTIPPPGADPGRVAEWWRSLSQETRDELLASRFDTLGRLRGLPAPVLDRANRRRVESDLATYSGELSDLNERITERALALGLDPSDEGALREDPGLADLLDERLDASRRVDNATSASARVAEATRSGYDTYVLSYDVDGPGLREGTLAIAYGDPDTATNVAVLVPGTLTTLDYGFPNHEAQALRASMDRIEPGNSTIAWLGYDAPTWDTTVATTDDAIDGAASLKADVDGYRAAASVGQHVTVLGHSYGSVAVGYAAMDGLAADDIAFLGSPGVGASSVDQLSPGAGHVWAGVSEHDPIVQATSGSWFTSDGSSVGPYDESFGANQFAVPDESDLVSAHLVYYSDESLSNLADIATGDYDAVTAGPGQEDRMGDLVSDVGVGLVDASGEALHGDWDAAWNELAGTGRELLNDVGDVVIGGTGDLVEAGKSVYDNTLGRLF
ncbi:alpha/beta hydrolase [Actinophytocola oryzae]|uniref:Alpha/beta hydrolase family protein n=1 Tax=Actinophytocola oryzae TaxID=502181 RepID=A0A4R7UY56_9PSEU|nr:alpha/beta hydrolase [Actinophytocola oryzae]TDV40006.1 alpha/beta hydrolase family protein [Actinophytocola oryzae]